MAIVDNFSDTKYGSSFTAKYYYDELMNEDRTTFSVYLYRGDLTDKGEYDSDSRISRNYANSGVDEILRGVISQNASMSTQFIWNGSPLNLTSAWANLASNLKSASRNLQNAGNNLKNAADTLLNSQGGRVLNWNQDAYYSINEFQKTFGGITANTPLVISSIILPYYDYTKKRYRSVKNQLSEFLDIIYKDEKQGDLKEYGKKMNIDNNPPSSDESGSDKKAEKEPWWKRLIYGIANAGSNFLNLGADLIDKAGSLLGEDGNYVLTLTPPHGYTGVPMDFVTDGWMANTLALRIGSRQLYNLLISSIQVTVSKELTYDAYGRTSPTQAQIDLTFIPVLVLKPSEIKEYVLDNLNVPK